MSVETISCVLILCDECGARAWRAHHDHTPIWTTLAQARRVLAAPPYSWRVDGDTYLCPYCARRNDCQRNGHDWAPWEPKAKDPTVKERWCAHCEELDEYFAEDTGTSHSSC